MMADDSDDDKPLLFQFKNSKGSVQAKCSKAASSLQISKEKPSKFPDCRDDGKSLEIAVKSLQKTGVLRDENPSSREPLSNNLTARVLAQNTASVKVYGKRKKDSDDENVGAKKIKSAGASNDTLFFEPASRNIDKGKGENAICKTVNAGGADNIVDTEDGSGLREPDADVDAIDSGNNRGADMGGRDHDDANSGTRVELKAKQRKLIDDRGNKIDDLRLACNMVRMKSLLSKAEIRMGSAKEEDEDDHLLLSELSRQKKNKGSVPKDMNFSSKKFEVKEQGHDILVKEEEEDDDLPLSKMSRPKKNKGSAMNDKKASSKENAVKEEALTKPNGTMEKKQLVAKFADVSNVSGNISEKKTLSLAKKQKDRVEVEQSLCLSKEEEDDDHLPLGQMARFQKRKASYKAQMPAEKDAGKGEEETRRDSDTPAVLETKLSEVGVVTTSAKLPEDKIDDRAAHADDVSQCSPPCTKREIIEVVSKEMSGKGKDVKAGLVCKSRAKQLLALSKSLEDIDSEEEEKQERVDVDDDDDDDEDEDEEEEDDDEDEDDDHNGSKAAKSTVEKSKSRTKPSTTLKARASGRSKSRTPISSSKSVKRKVVQEEEDDDDDAYDDDDEEENNDDSEEEDGDWADDDDEDNDLRGIKRKRKVVSTKKAAKEKQDRKRVKKMKDVPGAGGGQKWTTLEHTGVIFPPFYQPHGVKMLYEGKPVDLTPEQEEVATMFAVMKETDYAAKPKFLANFWNDWKKLLGPNHIIQKLEECDFTPIYEWHLAEKEKKKQLSSQEKKAIKEEKLKQEEKYMWAVVDGVKEKVGNFRVEPPGLFRGRGEHPKMGKLKRRIYPEDIVINIGAGSPIPNCPLPGHSWKEVRHDDTVTWLAYWNDPINTKEQKYVFLSPSSTLKGQSDKEKYEKARVLKDYIEDIRRTYIENFTSSDPTARQIAVATYLIDELALRAGNEKDDDEADTVGCCSLKVEHVTLIPPTSLQFDFLGKDSIRYFNVVQVVKPVYEAVGDFRKDKAAGIDLFDRLDTNKLNAHLKNLMPQLTAKVFRTYNASITLDNLLVETDGHLLAEKIAAYQRANKEVAILCNHQRSVSKAHGAQMEKLEVKLAELSDLVVELQKDLERARKGKPPLKDSDGNTKKNQNPDVLEKKILQTKQKMERMKLDMTIKEDLKTVALGTSKINYMDPRITVAWCKQHEVPIEKIFNKSLLAKFAWAMDVEISFRF